MDYTTIIEKSHLQNEWIAYPIQREIREKREKKKEKQIQEYVGYITKKGSTLVGEDTTKMWIIDFGCSFHITSKRDKFNEFKVEQTCLR